MQIYRNDAKNFKEGYGFKLKGKVIAEGSCLEVLFAILKLRQKMKARQRAALDILIFNCYGLHADERPNDDKQARRIIASIVTQARFI